MTEKNDLETKKTASLTKTVIGGGLLLAIYTAPFLAKTMVLMLAVTSIFCCGKLIFL